MRPTTAVVIGGYVNGLGVVRALAARGLRVGVVTTQPFDVAHRSRSAAWHVAVPGLVARPESLVEAIERCAPHGAALFATNDEALFALTAFRERLERSFVVVAPSPAAAAVLLDKRAMLEAAEAVGVPVPARDRSEFPLVVKPLVAYRFRELFGAKAVLARDASELAAWRERMDAAGIPGIVTDYVPGPDSDIHAYCCFLSERGEPIAGRTIRKLRQSPPAFGDARVATAVDDQPELVEASVAIARRIGLTGMAVFEFKRGRFIEVNGRPVVYNALLGRTGLDLPGLALGAAAEPNGWRGTWVHLHPDVLYSARDRIGFAEFAAPYRGPRVEAVWSARDPAPFLAQWSRTAIAAARRLPGTSRGAAPAAAP